MSLAKNKSSNFAFITDPILRENLDRVFDHILELLYLSESARYNDILKSSFRKTIIIYTASIIEGLLLYTLKQKKTEEECAQEKKEELSKQLLEYCRMDTLAMVQLFKLLQSEVQ